MKTRKQTCLICNIQQNRILLKSISWVLCSAVALPFAPVFGAELPLSVDQSAALINQADIDAAANGVPLINIVEANADGISHNKFSDYNVGTEGLIFNNSTVDIDSLLGGAIRANENLNGTSASLILNEVTSTNRSLLEGYQEVAGQAADVIIVNPNGITCNGCGFINTPQATLTTGLPQFIDGALAGFQVLGGDISIGSIGLDASDSQRFNLVTRSLIINGDIYANDLGIFTGSSNYDYNLRNATALSTDSVSPDYLVDSSALGGIYANRILLVGNEAGVGVRIRGDMAASTDDLIINTAGLIELTDSAKLFAGQNISIDNQGNNLIAENGYIYSVADLNIDVSNLQSNNFNFYSDGATNLNAVNWNQVGGEIDSTGAVSLSLQDSATFDGARIFSGDTLDINSARLLLRNGSSMTSAGVLTLHIDSILSENSLISTHSTAGITTDSLTMTVDQVDAATGLRSQGAMVLNTGVVSGNDNILSNDTLTVNSDSTFNNEATLNSSGQLQINANSILNSGRLLSGGQISSTATDINNEDGAVIAANGAITLGDGSGVLNNKGSAQISTDNNASLNLDFSEVDNEGTLNSDGELHLTTSELENFGAIYTSALLDIQTDSFFNAQGGFVGGDGTGAGQILGLGGLLENEGEILYGGDLGLSGFSDILNSNSISAKGNLSIDTPLFYQIGSIHSDKTLQLILPSDYMFTVKNGDVINGLERVDIVSSQITIMEDGVINSNESILFHSGSIDGLDSFINYGRILGGNIGINSKNVYNFGTGIINSANGSVRIRTLDLQNQGAIYAAQTLGVTFNGLRSITNNVVSPGYFDVGDGQEIPNDLNVLTNSGELYGRRVDIYGGVDNWGVINGDDSISISNPYNQYNTGLGISIINYQDAKIVANSGYLRINQHGQFDNGAIIYNHNSGIIGADYFQIKATTFTNDGDIIVGGRHSNSPSFYDKSTINVAQTFENTGLLFTNANLELFAGRIENSATGEIISNNSIRIDAIDNGFRNDGIISSGTYFNINIFGNDFNNYGTIQSVEQLYIDLEKVNGVASNFTNHENAKIFSVGNIGIAAYDSYFDNHGQINANGDFSYAGNARSFDLPDLFSRFDNHATGTLSSGGSLNVVGVADLTNKGGIFSGETIALRNDGGLINFGTIWAKGNINLSNNSTDKYIANWAGASIESYDGSIYIRSGSRVLNGGKLFSASQITIAAQTGGNKPTLENAAPGIISAGTRIFLSLYEFINSGSIQTPDLQAFTTVAHNVTADNVSESATDETPATGVGDNVSTSGDTGSYAPGSVSAIDDTSSTIDGAPVSESIPGVEIEFPEEGSGGLFVQSNPSNGYLIESRPEFGLAYLSSQWLLDLIADDPVVDIPVIDQPVTDDHDPSTVSDENIQSVSNSTEQTLRVGDGYYETILVRDQITELTDQRYIFEGVSDDSLQYQILLQNAAANYKALDLKLGIALSAEQVSNLAQDIVWMVEVEVDGKKALAPRVYLTEQTLSSIASGAKILGDTINIVSRGVMENTGTIKGGKVNVSASTTMTNRGLIEGRSVRVNGGEVSENYGTIRGDEYAGLSGAKMIQRKGSVLESLNGEVGFVGHEIIREEGSELNTDRIYLGLSSDWDNQGEYNGKKSIRGYVKNLINTGEILEAGQIDLSANNIDNKGGKIIGTEGKVRLVSKNGIDNTKGTIDAMGDVSLHAKDDITNKAGNIVGDNVSLVSTDGDIVNSAGDKIRIGNKKNYVEIQGKRGNITARSNLEMDAGGDIINAASDITAGGNAKLNAGGDVIFSAEVLKSKETKTKIKRTLLSSRATTTTKTTRKTVGSTLTVGGDLDLDAGGNATFTAAKVEVGGKANVDVGGNLELLSGQDSTKTVTETDENGVGVGGGIIGSVKIDETDFVGTNVATTFNAGGGNSNFTAGGDIVIQGSDLTTKGPTEVNAGGNLEILDGLDQSYNKKTTKITTYITGDSDSGSEAKSEAESDPAERRARANVSAGAEAESNNDLKLWKATETVDYSGTETSVASNLSLGGGSSVTAGETLTIRGSKLHADGALEINAKNLEVTAGRSKNWSSTKTTETSIGFYTESSAGADAEAGAQASAREPLATNVRGDAEASSEASATLTLGAQTKQESEYTLNINHALSSITSDGPLTINVEEKARFKGAVVKSASDLTINAQDIENLSVQDVSIHETSSSSHTGGLYVGGRVSAETNTQAQAEAVGAQDAHYQAEASAQADTGVRYKFEGESDSERTTTHVGNTFQAGGDLTRNASNTITDQATTLKAGGSIIQEATEITELAATNTHVVTHYEEEHEVRIGSYAGAGAEAEGEAGGSYLNRNGYNDASNEGGADASQGFSAKYEGSREDSSTTTKTAAVTTYEAGEDILSTSTGATTLIGTQMTAGNNIELNAQSLTVNVAEESTTHTETTHEGGAEIVVAKKKGGTKKSQNGINVEYEYGDLEENTNTVVTGNFTAGGGVSINTDGNLTLVGTDIKAGGPVSIDAGSVDFKAANEHQDSTEIGVAASLDHGQEVSGDNAKGARGEVERGVEAKDTNNVVSIRSGTGGTNITSRGDITMEGSDLDSTGATNIRAEGTVDLQAKENSSSSTDIGIQAGIDPEHEEGESKIKVRAGGNYNNEEATGFDRTNINSTGDITISGSNIIDQDSDVTSTEGNVTYEGDVTENAVNDESSSVDIEIHTGNIESKGKN